MDVDSKSDGQITPYVCTRAHTRICSLRVVKNYRTVTGQGLESHQTTMKKWTLTKYLQCLETHHPTLKKVPALQRPDFKNKGTSKHHKIDGKSPILRCIFLHQYLELFYKINPLHPTPFQKCSGVILIVLSKCWRRNVHPRFVSFFWFGSNPKYVFISF